jgi:YidC/Oxa1 family membrane protein insertase
LAPGGQHDSRRKKRLWASGAMALVFFVGFYPFPAGLMIYWITNNLLQLSQQLLVEFRHGRAPTRMSASPEKRG